MSEVGIPVGNIPYARTLTLPGYAAAVASGNRKRGRNLAAANAAVQMMLGRRTFNRGRLTNLYSQGLGDDSALSPEDWSSVVDSYAPDEVTEPPATSDSSWWSDVLKTMTGPLATGLGLGIGGKIAGVNPWAKPPVTPMPPAMSTTTKLVLAGGGILVGGYLLSRVLKKSGS